MQTHRHLPDVNRLSVLAAMILLAYAVTRFIDAPTRQIALQLPGFYLEINLNFLTIVSVLAAALAAAGMDWLIRDHPAFTEPNHPRVENQRTTFQHWIVPALTAWVIGVPLGYLETGPSWWIVFAMGGALLMLVFVMEYIVVDASDFRHPLATAGLTALSFSLYLLLSITVRSAHLRLYLLLPALVPAAGLVVLRTLYLRLGGRWTYAWSLGIAVVIGQLIIGLHYLPLSPIRFGLLVVAPLYALTSIAEAVSDGRNLRQRIAEPAAMLLILGGLAIWLK